MDCETACSPETGKGIFGVLIFHHPQNLTDAGNYGLYLPPCNGRAGKFLAEERVLSDYALSGSVASLEVSFGYILLMAVVQIQAASVHDRHCGEGAQEDANKTHDETLYGVCFKERCPESGRISRKGLSMRGHV